MKFNIRNIISWLGGIYEVIYKVIQNELIMTGSNINISLTNV